MGVTLALPILLTIAVKRLHSAKVTQAICSIFAGVLLLNEILPWGHRLGNGRGVRVRAVVPAVARL